MSWLYYFQHYYLSAEVVVVDVFGIDTKRVKHLIDCVAHHARTTHVVLDVFRRRVILEIGVVHHLMHKSRRICHSGSIGSRVGTVERKVELEVREILLKLEEIFEIEHFVECASTIEVRHLSVGDV